jgi:hypothetical protein
MNKLILVLISVLLGLGVLGYGLWTSEPNQSEVDALIPPTRAVDPDLLSNPTVQKIKQFDVNGQVPVEVPASEFGRDDPFAGF